MSHDINGVMKCNVTQSSTMHYCDKAFRQLLR